MSARVCLKRRDILNRSETKTLELIERSLADIGFAVWPGGDPLIRIRGSAIGEKEQITILEWILDCFRILRRERQRLEQLVGYFADMSAEAAEEGRYRPVGDLGLRMESGTFSRRRSPAVRQLCRFRVSGLARLGRPM